MLRRGEIGGIGKFSENDIIYTIDENADICLEDVADHFGFFFISDFVDKLSNISSNQKIHEGLEQKIAMRKLLDGEGRGDVR